MEQQIVEEAMKYLNPVDFIIDMYDMSYVWAGEKLLDEMGYSLDEFRRVRNMDLLANKNDEIKYRKDLSDLLAKQHGTYTLTLITKSGKKIRAEAEYQLFNFNGGMYMAGKGINVEFLLN